MKVPDARPPEAIRALPRCQRLNSPRGGCSRHPINQPQGSSHPDPKPGCRCVVDASGRRFRQDRKRVFRAVYGPAPSWHSLLRSAAVSAARRDDSLAAARRRLPRADKWGGTCAARPAAEGRGRTRAPGRQRGGPRVGRASPAFVAARWRLAWPSGESSLSRPCPNGRPDAVSAPPFRPDAPPGRLARRRRAVGVSDCRTGPGGTAGGGPERD